MDPTSPDAGLNPSPAQPRSRAVVLGASIAGLLAARVLADSFDEVLLLERDVLPEGPAPRKGTPQAVHPHGLLARGLQVLESLFPGFTESMQARGGLVGDLGADCAFDANRARFAPSRCGLNALAASRLAIEAELRGRVLGLAKVRARTGVVVGAPVHRGGRVVAARYRGVDDRVPGHRPWPVRLVNAYIGRLYRVAPQDAVVSAAFQRVVHMVDPPPALFAPALLWRVLKPRRPQRLARSTDRPQATAASVSR